MFYLEVTLVLGSSVTLLAMLIKEVPSRSNRRLVDVCTCCWCPEQGAHYRQDAEALCPGVKAGVVKPVHVMIGCDDQWDAPETSFKNRQLYAGKLRVQCWGLKGIAGELKATCQMIRHPAVVSRSRTVKVDS